MKANPFLFFPCVVSIAVLGACRAPREAPQPVEPKVVACAPVAGRVVGETRVGTYKWERLFPGRHLVPGLEGPALIRPRAVIRILDVRPGRWVSAGTAVDVFFRLEGIQGGKYVVRAAIPRSAGMLLSEECLTLSGGASGRFRFTRNQGGKAEIRLILEAHIDTPVVGR